MGDQASQNLCSFSQSEYDDVPLHAKQIHALLMRFPGARSRPQEHADESPIHEIEG